MANMKNIIPRNCSKVSWFLKSNSIKNVFKRHSFPLVFPPVSRLHYYRTEIGDRDFTFARNFSMVVDCLPGGISMNDNMMKEIISRKSCNDLLNFVHSVNADELNVAHTWFITKKMLMLYHEQLMKELPWLQSNIDVAYIQLVLQGKIHYFAEQFSENSSCDSFYKLILRDCDHFSEQQLADCLLAVHYLGIPLDGPVTDRLRRSFYKQLPKFDLVPLSQISSIVLRSSSLSDLIAVRAVFKRTDVILKNLESSQPSAEELGALTQIIANTFRFTNADFMEKFNNIFVKTFNREEILCIPDNLCTFLRLFLKKGHELPPAFRCLPMYDDIVEVLIKAIYDSAELLEHQHIADICDTLRKENKLHPRLATRLEKRAVQLLNENCRLCEITNLMYALTSNTSTKVCRQFENVLLPKISNGSDVDVIILSNIADTLSHVKNLVSQDTVRLFLKLVVQQADSIVMYVKPFRKISKYLHYQHMNSEDKKKFTDSVLKYLYRTDGFNIRGLDLRLFLFAFAQGVLPDQFYEEIISSIPQWDGRALCKLVSTINHTKRTSIKTKKYIRLILDNVYLRLSEELISEIHSVDIFCSMIFTLVKNNNNPDPNVTDSLLRLYPKLTQNLTELQLSNITRSLLAISYYLPEVYDNLVRSVVNNADSISDHHVVSVVQVCAKVGHQPQMINEFMQAALKVYRKMIKNVDFKNAVSLLNQLSVISCYPEPELCKLFSLEAMQDLDYYLEENPQHSRDLEKMLMELNRGIVLDCPQLDIIWLNGECCQERLSAGTGLEDDQLLQVEVHDAVNEVLGGPEFFKKDAISPYFHHIDFECILDRKSSTPIKTDEWKSSTIDNHQRIMPEWKHSTNTSELAQDNVGIETFNPHRLAICVYPENSYCLNSRWMIGKEQMRKRHLEILDYKVVEVPHFDWNSMALHNWQSKVDFLRKKIMT